jgi:serine/threonine protein kinase
MKGEIFLEKIKISELGKDLLKRLLEISPNQRPSSSYSLKHRYFSQYPSEFRTLGINTERETVRTVHSE